MKERKEYSPEEYGNSIKAGVAIGFVAGLLLGVAQVLYINSPALYSHPLMVSIPIWQAIGWALFGMIVGSGGIFANVRLPHRVARPAEPASAWVDSPQHR